MAGGQFELTFTGPPGFSFTAVTTDTIVSTYYSTHYFCAAATDNELGLPLYINPRNPFPKSDFTAADTAYPILGGSPGYTALSPGYVYSLALVSYSVGSTVAPGSVETN